MTIITKMSDTKRDYCAGMQKAFELMKQCGDLTNDNLGECIGTVVMFQIASSLCTDQKLDNLTQKVDNINKKT